MGGGNPLKTANTMKEKLPFQTNNRTLAMALHFGGCHILGIWRIYTPEELVKLDCSAQEAATRNIGGKVKYFLEDNENRAVLEAAFDGVANCENLNLPTVGDEDAVRIVHLLLQFRKGIEKWLHDPACAIVLNPGSEPYVQDNPDGTKSVVISGVSAHGAPVLNQSRK